MKHIIKLILIIFLITITTSSSFAACDNKAILKKVVYSLNDPNFSKDYDGTSGIIQTIEATGNVNIEYSLWQSPNIAKRITSHYNTSMENYYAHDSNVNSFAIDSSYNSNKYNTIVINEGTDNFDLYYNVTFKNTGTCDGNNEAWLLYTGENALKYYGVEEYSSYFDDTSVTPLGKWRFTGAGLEETKSKVFHFEADNIRNKGILEIKVGPEAESTPHYQKITNRFFVEGLPAICGDSHEDYGETCDDGNTINGDGCSSTCQDEACIDNIQVERIVFSLDDATHSALFDGTSGIIQIIDSDIEGEKFSLWQTPLLNHTLTYPWNGNSANVISFNNGDIRSPINFDTDFENDRNRVLYINKNNSDNFNLYYNITLKNSGTCNYNDDSIIDRRDGNRILYYGSSSRSGFPEYNDIFPSHWYPANILANRTISRNFQVANNQMNNYGLLQLRVGPHDRNRVDGEKHYQYFNANFLINLPEPECGNAIIEAGEVCDLGSARNGQVGESCSATCQLVPPVNPIIAWENKQTVAGLWSGKNLTPGENITLEYSVYNPKINITQIEFRSVLHTLPFSKQSDPAGSTYYNSNYHYKFFDFFMPEIQYQREMFDESTQIITVNPGETIYFNRTIQIPEFTPEIRDVIERIVYYENFRYRIGTIGAFIVPRDAGNNIDYDWWHSTPEMIVNSDRIRDWTHYTLHFNDNRKQYFKSTNPDYSDNGGWFSRSAGIGSYFPLYTMRLLTTDYGDLDISVSDQGVASVETRYYGGIVRSTSKSEADAQGETVVPANTFYLDARLHFKNGSQLYQKNIPITKEFSKSNNAAIRYNEAWQPGLGVDELVSFDLVDFNKLNEQEVYFNVTPRITRTNQPLIFYNDFISENKFLNLDKPVSISIDSPVVLRPNGNGSINNLYQRILFFNYLEYAIFDINLNVTFLDGSDNDISHLYEHSIEDIALIPAGSAFPLGINIKYIGPTTGLDIYDHQLRVSLNYFDPSLDSYLDEPLIEKTNVRVYKNPVFGSFIDLIPRDMNYTLLNLDNQSKVNIVITNQGTQNSGSFTTDLYVRSLIDLNFTHVNQKTLPSLGPGETTVVQFNFTPYYLGNFVIKTIVNENKAVFEDTSIIEEADNNNILTSIALVRDLDVFLENVIIDYDNAYKGVIPIKVFASNKIIGGGGIDTYEMRLTLKNAQYTYTESKYFIQIPEEGKEVIYYLNVTNMEPGTYSFNVMLDAPFDPDLSDNEFNSVIDFCPTPWYNGPLSCNRYCTESCLHPVNQRYLATCHTINGCYFRDEVFAESCDNFREGTYVPIIDINGTVINLTHEVQCHQGIKFREKLITDELLDIDGNCQEIIINKIPGLFNSIDVIINIAECLEPEE